MSIPERIFRISKAYINQVRDRIDSELSDAEREAAAELPDGPSGVRPGESEADSMMRRAEEKIAAARRDLDSHLERQRASGAAPASADVRTSPAIASQLPRENAGTAATIVARSEDPNAADFRVLGVPVGSDLTTVTASYEHLAARCDPRRYPEGSSDQEQAQRILEKITASYEALRRRLDPTSNRFGKLEFE